MKKTKITFTGVDEWTDLDRLSRIQEKYPEIEFGVLFSETSQGKNPRYPSKTLFFEELTKYSLNLSVHVCGRMAREIWSGKETFPVWAIHKNFKRCQLNVSSYGVPSPDINIVLPENIEETIIQWKPENLLQPVWSWLKCNTKLAVLLDGSGGKGVESSFGSIVFNDSKYRIGFAGGISPNNFLEKWHQANQLTEHGDFWLDMESGVRTDDKFNLEKVEYILQTYENNIKKELV